MEDLIKRDDAIKVAKSFLRNEDEWFQEALASQIRMIPSAESTGDLDNAIYEYVQDGLMSNPYDRPQGKWIELHNPNLGMCMEYLIQCSVCGRCMCGRYQPYRSFCPNCGADMRGDDNE